MLPNCSHLLTDFRTVFVFALGPFLPMNVIFFYFNGNFNGKMANGHFGHLWPSGHVRPIAASGVSLKSIKMPINVEKLPTWERKVLEEKQKQF